MKAGTISVDTGKHTLHPLNLQQRRKERTSTQEQGQYKDEVLLPGSCPEGVSLEQVPAETRHLLEVALPEEGSRLLAHLLRYATCTPQHTLPATWAARIEKMSDEPRALVVVRSLKALAHSEDSPCGPDRYHHLTLACEALGILTRQVHRCGAAYCTVLSVALHPTYALPPAIIQTCQQMEQRYANPRVQRLLISVRMRVQAQISSSTQSSSPAIQPLLFHMEQLVQHYEQQAVPQAPLVHLIHQMLRLVLENTYFPAPTEQDMHLSQSLFQQQSASSDSFVQKPGSNPASMQIPAPAHMQALNQENSFEPSESRNLPERDTYLSAGMPTARKRNRFLPSQSRNLSSSVSINDSFFQERFYENKAATFIDRIVPGTSELSSVQPSPLPSRPTSARRRTASSAHPTSNEAEFTASQLGQQHFSQSEYQEAVLNQYPAPEGQHTSHSRNMRHSRRASTPERAVFATQDTMQKGAYEHPAQSPHTWQQVAQSSHTQAQSSFEQEEAYRDSRNHTQIRREAALYARLLDGHARWMGKLVQCVQQYPANIRRLAFIDTLSRLYGPDGRGRPNRPGAWFCYTCERLTHEEVPLPDEVYQWAATELDEEQIASAIQSGQLFPRTEELQSPIWPGTGQQQAPEDERAGFILEEADHWAGSAMPPSQEPMDRAMAEQLAARVSQDVASDSDPSQVEILESRYLGIWQVLLIWKQGVEVLLDTEEQWVSYFKRVQDTAALMKLMNYRG
ncbi:hypothetical protein KSF_065650 [Reticulibacter mediterranei]|uniref:Uncharacterized protein n=1 Tax=Reticulibacter mediterranei TaxID=2778369 RepID=A0A8J3N303_9CHLR|nr:hypothetical protein [Reticulibacter mediterranei]GHO96517.1 hypothetical protein KSF_065650 [Reticulibacter mediterranei]